MNEIQKLYDMLIKAEVEILNISDDDQAKNIEDSFVGIRLKVIDIAVYLGVELRNLKKS